MCFFCFNDTATTQIYTYLHTLSLHDALPIWLVIGVGVNVTSFPRETRVPASSLHFEGCPPDVTAVDLLEAFGRHLLARSEAHTSTPVTNAHLVCRLLLEKKKKEIIINNT